MEAVARAKTAIAPAAPRVAQVHLKARLLQVAGMVTGLKFLFCNFFQNINLTALICYFGGLSQWKEMKRAVAVSFQTIYLCS